MTYILVEVLLGRYKVCANNIELTHPLALEIAREFVTVVIKNGDSVVEQYLDGRKRLYGYREFLGEACV